MSLIDYSTYDAAKAIIHNGGYCATVSNCKTCPIYSVCKVLKRFKPSIDIHIKARKEAAKKYLGLVWAKDVHGKS